MSAITESASPAGYIYMDRQYMIELADKWLKGTITPEEELEFDKWYDHFADDKDLNMEVSFAESPEALRHRIYESLVKVLAGEESVVKKNRSRVIWGRYLVAASIILLLGAAGYLMVIRKSPRGELAIVPARGRDVAPGHDGAILTLGDGHQIVLDSVANGAVAAQGNMQVIKQNGRISYKAGAGASTDAQASNAQPTDAQMTDAQANNARAIAAQRIPAVTYNTMTTPRGRQFQLVLPDGSMVWLNAASSITYPTVFTGPQREVRITGEAYFEVKHSENQTFRVKVGNTLVEDLGTHFDIDAYPDDPALRTTLLEGAVRVSGQHGTALLKPGQQARSEGTGPIDVLSDVDLDATMAWKNGKLSLQNADVKAIFRQISRWYDMDVQYEGTMPGTQFWGIIGRNVSLSNVLHVLEANGIYAQIKGNVIVVSTTKLNQTDTMK